MRLSGGFVLAGPKAVSFYDVQERQSVEVPAEDVEPIRYLRRTTTGRQQTRYALRARRAGRYLTKFVGQADWEAWWGSSAILRAVEPSDRLPIVQEAEQLEKAFAAAITSSQRIDSTDLERDRAVQSPLIKLPLVQQLRTAAVSPGELGGGFQERRTRGA